jgi:hypothetical protein
MDDASLTEEDIKRRLRVIEELQGAAQDVKRDIQNLSGVEHLELAQTFRQAEAQLPSIETDLRKRLARLSPGDPEGIVDLDVLQDRLNERSARQEMGLPTDQEIPAILELKTSPGNIAGAAFLGVFGTGWNAFTAVHATFMIGGMFKAFGWPALALLAFYAIFFLVGFGMWAGAVSTASSESIELHGRTLTVIKKLGSWIRRKTYELAPDAKASVGMVESSNFRAGNSNTKVWGVLLTDVEGRSIGVAQNASDPMRTQIKDRINAYLAAQAETPW